MIASVGGLELTSLYTESVQTFRHPQFDYRQHGKGQLSFAPQLSPSEASVRFGDLEFLQLIIHDRSRYGLLDNQASCNFMSKSFARENNIDIEAGRDVITVGDARVISTIGRARIQCVVLLKSRHIVDCEFEVLELAVQPIILGKPFFRSNNTLFNVRLIDQPSRPPSIILPELYAAASQCPRLDFKLKVRLRCKMIEKEALATIDKAATADLMSSGLARRLGLSVSQQRKPKATIFLGDGRRIQSAGTIQIAALFVGYTGRSKKLPIEFIVVQTLAFEMVLGSPTLRSLGQWAADDTFLDWIPVPESRILLCPFQVNKDSNLTWENQALFLQNEKIQEDAKKQNAIMIQLQNDQRTAGSLAEREKLVEKRDLAQERMNYFLSAGDTDKASEFEKEVRRLNEFLQPSQAPSTPGDRLRRRQIWHFLRH